MSQKLLINGRFMQGGEIRSGSIIADTESGLILDLRLDGTCEAGFEGQRLDFGSDCLICPGDFNGHSHPEQSLYTDLVDRSWDLPTWCRNTIYKYSPALKPQHIYLACCRAFSRMLSYGVTSVMVSFYCHNNSGNLYDLEVIRAARDVGIRLYFGRMSYDITSPDAYEAKKLSQKCYYETVAAWEQSFLELLQEVNTPAIVIAPSIHSIHASTREAIVNAINIGNEYDRLIQFHLSEDKGDVDLSLKWYGQRPIKFLEGLLKKGEVESLGNLMLSDCVWIDDEERELIKKYNMKIVLNPRMNDRIKAGEADLPKLLDKGIDIFLGTDGEASNDDLSITGECNFLRSRFPDLEGKINNAVGVSPLSFGGGRVGTIFPGNYCDLKVIQGSKLLHTIVGGKTRYLNGRLTCVDMENDIEKPLQELVKKLMT